jgi:hypothetical protein
MDSNGACFSLGGMSLTGALNSTRFSPALPSVDGTAALTINQKLDRLISLSSSQANELVQAREVQEKSQKELEQLRQNVSNLEEQLESSMTNYSKNGSSKLPRAVSVSSIQLTLHMSQLFPHESCH